MVVPFLGVGGWSKVGDDPARMDGVWWSAAGRFRASGPGCSIRESPWLITGLYPVER